MGFWQDSLVYYRDFGYPDHSRRRLAMAQNGNVGDVSAKTFAELLAGPIVDIYVGDTKRHWPLHRNLLAYHSDYLQAELQHTPESTPKSKGKGKEVSDSLRLDLPDDDPAGFELLVKWLYQGKIEDVSNIADDQEKYDYAVACQKLHQLCDRFEIPKLKNIAMDQYRKGLSQARLVPDAEELNTIYRQSPEASPFRKLMVNIAARQIMDPDSEKDAESYRQCFENNASFAIDLVNAIKTGMGGRLFEDPTEKTDCDYHDHDVGQCHNKGKKRLVVSRSNQVPRPETPTPANARSGRPSRSSSGTPPEINGFAQTDDGASETSGGAESWKSFAGFEVGTERANSSAARNPVTPGRKAPRKLVRRSNAPSEYEPRSEQGDAPNTV